MKWRNTILLCLLSAMALALIVPSTLAGRRDATERGTRLLFDEDDGPLLSAERVEEIVIERPRAAPIVLRRSGDGWIEHSPSGLPVDPFAVRELLGALRRLAVSRTVLLDEELSIASGSTGSRGASSGHALLRDLALDPPEATVTLRDRDGELALRLGRVGVAGRAFVQRGDRPGEVVVVGQEIHAMVLQQDPASWRVRSLFAEVGAETRRIEYQVGTADESGAAGGPGGVGGALLRLVRMGDAWRMELPVATRVDPTAMAAYLSALARAECEGFLGDVATPERAAECGLSPPAATISVQGAERPRSSAGRGSAQTASAAVGAESAAPRATTLLVGRPIAVGGDDRFGSLEGHPVLMRLSKVTLQSLFVSPTALIAPTACAVLPANVKLVRIEGPSGRFSLARDLDRWVAPDSGAANIEPARIDELFRSLTAAQASAILLKPIPRELVVGRIELVGFDGSLLVEIEVAADPTGTQYALEAGDGVARVFPASSAPALAPEAYGLPASAATPPAPIPPADPAKK